MNLAKYIDHTLLKADATSANIIQLCKEAFEHQFYAVCVNSSFVKLASEQINQFKTSSLQVASVVGFPLGVLDTTSKAFETSQAIKNGATEIDMVIHIGALKEKNYGYVQEDIYQVVQAAQGHKVKVILETALLTDDEKKKACELSLKAKAHFVKTCTGFGGGGATVSDILLMKSIVGNELEIKASGGIKTSEFAIQLIQAGANRLGTSSGIALIQNLKINSESY